VERSCDGTNSIRESGADSPAANRTEKPKFHSRELIYIFAFYSKRAVFLMVRREDFEWDDDKRLWTLRERGLDFEKVITLFEGFMVESDSPREREHRIMAVGMLNGRHVTVI
jgi:hypothetical protein